MSAEGFPEGFNPFGGSGTPAEEGIRQCLKCDAEYYWPADGTYRYFCSMECWWKY